MKLAIMQPYFFPYIGYFQLIHAVDRFILYDNLNYIKWGWVNRNRLVINGHPSYIIVPLKEKSSFTKIRHTRIARTERWRQKMLRAIQLSYSRSAHFGEVFPLVQSVINTETELLAQLNLEGIVQVAKFLGITTEIVADVTPYDPLEADLADPDSEIRLSYRLLQNLDETKVVRALCICKDQGAETFVNAIGGRTLYDKEIFRQNGIELYFIHTLPYSYSQKAADFHPAMSIIDVLMNCGRDGTRLLLDKFRLV